MKSLLRRRYSRGAAMMEMALALPLLIALAIPVYSFALNMMAQHMVTNVSREVASLDARIPSPDMQSLMGTVASTVTPPFDFTRHGMIFLTEVQGADPCDPTGAACRNLAVLRQFRWLNPTSPNKTSMIYPCPPPVDPSSGSCTIAANATATFTPLIGQLFRGQVVYMAEAFYDDPPQIGGLRLGMGIDIPLLDGNLYSVTAF